MKKLLLVSLVFLFSISIHADPCASFAIELLSSYQKDVPYAHKGHFTIASDDVLNQVKKVVNDSAKEGAQKKLKKSNIKRVTSNDLITDLNKKNSRELNVLLKRGLDQIGELAYITSGAGLWSRGGGVIKALVPYNLEIIARDQIEHIKQLGQIISAKKIESVVSLANPDSVPSNPADLSKWAKQYIDQAKVQLKGIIESYTKDPKAINAIDMKMVNVALNSQQANKYVSFDIWTSEQTHTQIANYLDWFNKNYTKKVFHLDPSVDRKIKAALGAYIDETAKRKQTHLFGYQEGIHGIDTASGEFNTDTAPIGKGAGAIIEYLAKSGRRAELKTMGVHHVVFENIEIVSQMPTLYGSFLNSNSTVGVVLVPAKEGYAGGSPFLVKGKSGNWNLELHEMSAISEEYVSGNEFFNSNTIFFDININPPKTMGVELKEQGTLARIKQNMGDITLDNPTIGIGGRVGDNESMVEYENFKTYGEYAQKGHKYIERFQNFWKKFLHNAP